MGRLKGGKTRLDSGRLVRWFCGGGCALLLAYATACEVHSEVVTETRGALTGSPPVLTVATWNIAYLRAQEGLGPHPRTAKDFRRLRAVADALAADVVAVQEVEGEEALRRVFDPARYDFHLVDQPGIQRTGFAYLRSLNVERLPDYRVLDVGGLRYGAELAVRLGTRRLRLLAVHLKARCASGPIDKDSEACRKLRAQVPMLERWIDARSREGIPFMVLGDFNRRLFARSGGDEVWRDLDDGDPRGMDLISPTMDGRPRCWEGAYPHFIDHLVMDHRAARWFEEGSFAQHLYRAPRAQKPRLSDHCPLSVRMRPGLNGW